MKLSNSELSNASIGDVDAGLVYAAQKSFTPVKYHAEKSGRLTDGFIAQQFIPEGVIVKPGDIVTIDDTGYVVAVNGTPCGSSGGLNSGDSSVSDGAGGSQDGGNGGPVSPAVNPYARWEPGTTYTKGDIVRWNGKLYAAMSDVFTLYDEPPDATPGLWACLEPVSTDIPSAEKLAAWLNGFSKNNAAVSNVDLQGKSVSGIFASAEVDMDGDVLSPEAIASINEQIAGFPGLPVTVVKGTSIGSYLIPTELTATSMGIYPAEKHAGAYTPPKKQRVPSRCHCGGHFVFSDVTNGLTSTYLSVVLECLGCGMEHSYAVCPKGDDTVGEDYDRVSLLYFKGAES